MTTKPAKSVEVLADYFSRLRKSPAEIPEDNYAAARWFISIMEPAKEYEAPREKSKTNGDGSYWVTPYTDRLLYCLRIYLSLCDKHRQLIRDASDKEVYWNGIDISFFKLIFQETMNARGQDNEQYRREAIKKMRETIGGMTR